MRDRAPLRAALEHPNVRAFLRVIRAGESSQEETAYRLENGGRIFDEIQITHPSKGLASPPGRAFGAYQFLASTWGGLVAQYGFESMSEACQDEAAVALIAERHGLEPVIAGDLDEAFARLNRPAPMWTSLPGGTEPNAATSRAVRTFIEWGGQLAHAAAPETDPARLQIDTGPAPAFNPDSLETEHYGEAITESTAPPQEEPAMPSILEEVAAPVATALAGPVGGLLVNLAGSLIEGFAPLAQEKLTKELARHTDSPQVAAQVAGGIVDAAKKVTGKADAIAAVAAARADPAVMAQVEAQALANLAALAPVLDKVAELAQKDWAAEEASRDAATRRAALEPNDQGPFLTRATVGGVFGLLLAMTILAGVLAWLGKPVGEILTFITTIGGVIVGGYKTVIDHRFGSSRSSGAKDIVIQQLASNRKP